MKTLRNYSHLLLSFALVIFAWKSRGPFLLFLRGYALPLVLILSLFLLFKNGQKLRRSPLRAQKLMAIGSSILLFLSMWMGIREEFYFREVKTDVLRSDPALLQKWGKHFVVGFENWEDLEVLVSKGAVGGIFITRKNIQNFSKDEIRKRVEKLQTFQRNLQLPPLWVTTDQEGGKISKLSPPLTLQPSLNSLVDSGTGKVNSEKSIRDYASLQARGLSELGINLNLSPVVDLKIDHGVNLIDGRSRIYERAISGDPETITAVALPYIDTLESFGITPTLKHFPGLGGVEEDTHIQNAKVEKDLETLEKSDWKPFLHLLENTHAFLMLSHASLEALDPENPCSVSKKVIEEIIRKEWNYQRVLITDDFTMGPIYSRSGGVGQASVDALNASVDLILISYDPDLYYQALEAVIHADTEGKMNTVREKESEVRMQQAFDEQKLTQLKTIVSLY